MHQAIHYSASTFASENMCAIEISRWGGCGLGQGVIGRVVGVEGEMATGGSIHGPALGRSKGHGADLLRQCRNIYHVRVLILHVGVRVVVARWVVGHGPGSNGNLRNLVYRNQLWGGIGWGLVDGLGVELGKKQLLLHLLNVLCWYHITPHAVVGYRGGVVGHSVAIEVVPLSPAGRSPLTPPTGVPILRPHISIPPTTVHRGRGGGTGGGRRGRGGCVGGFSHCGTHVCGFVHKCDGALLTNTLGGFTTDKGYKAVSLRFSRVLVVDNAAADYGAIRELKILPQRNLIRVSVEATNEDPVRGQGVVGIHIGPGWGSGGTGLGGCGPVHYGSIHLCGVGGLCCSHHRTIAA
eukprot:comp24153_c1_seq1/m.43980 comp24153_c1_seq1/g.43980  ORF comp24153_c1_seq1/g.43980 comp24153_c1_seq1/m.43980 type:complete len:351 (+) comp24153_c1_seq1:639-1691(+)